MPRATRREWIGLAVLALPCFLVSMDMTVLNLAIPHLTADLRPTGTQLLWIVDIYGFLVAGSLVTMGTLGDRIGRRKLLLFGAVAFGVASALAAFAKSPAMLIAMRAVLGVAGATLAPSTLSLIRNMFLDERQRTVAISIWMTSFSIGGVLGPLVGGSLLQYFWWGSVFLPNVPVMLLLLALGPALLPEFKDPQAGRIDIASAALSLFAILSLIFGLKQFAEPASPWLPWAAVVLAFTLGAVFLRRQRTIDYPFVDLTLFGKREFVTALSMNVLLIISLWGVFFLVAQYLQLVLGLNPLKAGLAFIPASLAYMVGSMLVPRLSTRWRPAYFIAGGLFFASLGFWIVTRVDTHSSVALVVLASVIYQFALTPVFTLSTAIVVGAAPKERAGSAAAISETSYELGGALGIATLGTLATVLYRSRLEELLPATAPADLAEAARGTLGAAVALAGRLPASVSDLVLGPAREAFLHAMRSVAWISTFVVLLLSFAVAFLLRSVTLGEE